MRRRDVSRRQGPPDASSRRAVANHSPSWWLECGHFRGLMVRGARRNAPERSSPRGRDGERARRDRRAASRMPHRRHADDAACGPWHRRPHDDSSIRTAAPRRPRKDGAAARTASGDRCATTTSSRPEHAGQHTRARTKGQDGRPGRAARTDAAKRRAAGTPLGALTIGQSTLDTHHQDAPARRHGRATGCGRAGTLDGGVPRLRVRHLRQPEASAPGELRRLAGSVFRSSAALTCFG